MTYRRDRRPIYRCSNCRRLQKPRELPLSLQGAVSGRWSSANPNAENEPRSLINRALGALRLS